ncbi:acyl-CoA dehydrogenase family protein [Novosphingobium album (ex Liu et al. 2023)]|uniref:Acyl-CoA dehydrogenase family protein n=1 Tax=Novosphingobium album (ex Liu et al. 2023) TaxID=3031130 RepID=A0ABT5WXA1_9SPHN|nr:acyl-CoA dehydrogenase family protein [Novosphingobium album (ex Liu et al. 2023)]MDE8654522.1 acyl-CoA dehydrogenase family protein [Novosphingobium album (ex Liu et al. 2023)]
MGWTLSDLPFFDARHRALGERLAALPPPAHPEPRGAEEVARRSRESLRWIAGSGLLDIVVPRADASGARRIDVRALCLVREFFGYHDLLADTMFTMQGIGTAALWLAGTAAQQQRYLDRCRAGESIAALALTEPEAGSDVAALATTARREGDHFVIDGAKTLITNAGIADHYIVIARTGEEPGARGLSAFMLDAGTPGLEVGEPIDLIAPHPLGSLRFDGCRVPADALIGAPGQGFKAAMAVFDIFRPSVGAAGVGVARRALDEALGHVRQRVLFGKPMARLEGVQARIADMATDTETAALAVYRAAWAKDVTGGRCSREASMAKLVGSEAAQRVVDAAVQLFGGRGITKGYMVEQLYREVRGMRIYEGASEVQRMIIARDLLA